MSHYVLSLEEIDSTMIAIVGGKAAQLGELRRIDGVRVPPGFCVTTNAFRRVVAGATTVDARLERLKSAMPEDVAAAIEGALARLGRDVACAIRSSATAEDLPTASFAGQHDTYLNIAGIAAVLEHIRRCWASLFSERALTYRQQNGIDDQKVAMAVVVQQMVFADAAGVMFTADPVSGHRKVTAVEATIGLGEALVSGLVNTDTYKVRDSDIVEKTVRHEHPALTDEQVVRLTRIGRLIEAHFGRPQDIEWCLKKDDEFSIVQSRPITTLFPIPEVNDNRNHVYISVGHQQMMTDPMKPLGLSLWNLTTPRPMSVAAGRLFVDVTQILASPATRNDLLAMAGRSDPLIGDALQTIVDRGDFIQPLTDGGSEWTPPSSGPAPLESDSAIVLGLIERTQDSLSNLRRAVETKSGPALLDFIQADLQELKRILFNPQSRQAALAGMEAAWWLNDKLQEWLGEKNAADALTLSAPNNITSEMGLALLNVADVIRPHAEVIAFLEQVDDESFLDELPALPGGREARDAIRAWLDKYGMRGVGEIDITRPRWSERPHTLLPVILSNVRNFEPGAAKRRVEQGQQAARQKEQQLLARLRSLPNGEQKAEETKRVIDRLRTFIGYREYPKYGMISRQDIYKQALLGEAERLVQAHVLREKEDIFYLTFHELHEVVRTTRVDHDLIRERRDAFESYRALTPPRVLTSDGEALSGAYRRDDFPDGALVGLAVSAGVVEGRARVIFNVSDAELGPDDILVTAYTDPSWTPLFIGIKGVVTEVGGLMTHGAVIAREYGLPAVVGVERATQLIRDGQRIRLHGSEGYVELLA